MEESRAKPVENRGFSKSPLAEIPRQLCCEDMDERIFIQKRFPRSSATGQLIIPVYHAVAHNTGMRGLREVDKPVEAYSVGKLNRLRSSRSFSIESTIRQSRSFPILKSALSNAIKSSQGKGYTHTLCCRCTKPIAVSVARTLLRRTRRYSGISKISILHLRSQRFCFLSLKSCSSSWRNLASPFEVRCKNPFSSRESSSVSMRRLRARLL